ncbi:MAG: type II toxin-antitoxin system VapC family toxin [Archaeoglobus sp.]|nr:type II toxin-antitoxin system VapC family toxin [Archaeoglobus sp.]
MPSKIVLDSNVIAAIFFREDGVSEVAEKIVEEYSSYYTLDLAIAEITNVAWKKVVFEREPVEIVKNGLEKSIEFITSVCEVVSSAELYDFAFKIAVERNLSAYDSLFVALSAKYNLPLATSDRKLFEKVDNGILVRQK